jgi:NAD(P)-dependent dehydrogenase (short-subunit alcohol dehydrogenase family)
MAATPWSREVHRGWDLPSPNALSHRARRSSVAADVSNLNSVTSALQKTFGIVPTIDIFINNAGISGPNAKLWEYPDDRKRIFAVNVEGMFYCCRTVVPLMRERNYGRIVNIASVAGKDGNPNASAWLARDELDSEYDRKFIERLKETNYSRVKRRQLRKLLACAV